MGVVDAAGFRGSRQSALELMGLNLKLFDSMFGSQSTVAPPLPTAVDFIASLPEAAPIFATTYSSLFPGIARLLDATEILAFLSSHYSLPIDMKPAIPRFIKNVVDRFGT